MGINNNCPCFSFSPFSDRKNYQKPAIWIDKLPQVSIICAGSDSGFTGEGGDSNKDNILWDENESHGLEDKNQNRILWDEDE